MTQRAVSALDAYQLRLPVFEGPLDVLLRLIERDQLEISEVSLLAVFDQFMAFARALDSLSPLVIAEFAAVAGRLSVLKSRALLPAPARPVDDLDGTDLVRQLLEYRAVKSAAELLAARQRDGSGVYGRGESIALPESAPAPIAPQSASALENAVRRWLTRLPTQPVLLPPRRVVSLREMIFRVTSLLIGGQAASFDTIKATCIGRHEVSVAFLALLVLLRRDSIVAVQEELFGSILLSATARGDASTFRSLPAAPDNLDGWE